MKLYTISNFSTVKIILQNSFKNTKKYTIYCVKTEGSGYCQLAGRSIYCYANSLFSLNVSWARDSCMQMEHFHAHDDSEIDIWTTFWEEKQYNSTHCKNIAHCSGPNMVKSTIVHYVFRTLTLWNSLFRYNCHEWLRPDLEIPFSNSSNKHGTGKADEIFTEVWRDTFYTIAMWKFSENSRDSRRRLTYLFNGELYYLSPMNEKR